MSQPFAYLGSNEDNLGSAHWTVYDHYIEMELDDNTIRIYDNDDCKPDYDLKNAKTIVYNEERSYSGEHCFVLGDNVFSYVSTAFWFYNRGLSLSIHSNPKSKYAGWLNGYILYKSKEDMTEARPYLDKLQSVFANKIAKALPNARPCFDLKLVTTEKKPEGILDTVKLFLFPEYETKKIVNRGVITTDIDIERLMERSKIIVNRNEDRKLKMAMENSSFIALYTICVKENNGLLRLKIIQS